MALGFLSGCEPQWLPGVMHVLREELPRIEVTISSKHSPQLAEGLGGGVVPRCRPAVCLSIEWRRAWVAMRTPLWFTSGAAG